MGWEREKEGRRKGVYGRRDGRRSEEGREKESKQ